jgi:hypothetical protein
LVDRLLRWITQLATRKVAPSSICTLLKSIALAVWPPAPAAAEALADPAVDALADADADAELSIEAIGDASIEAIGDASIDASVAGADAVVPAADAPLMFLSLFRHRHRRMPQGSAVRARATT